MAARKAKATVKKATAEMVGKGVRVVWTDAESKDGWHTTTELVGWVKPDGESGPTYGILHEITDDFLVVISTHMGAEHVCHSWKIPTAWISDITVIDEEPPI